MSDHARGSGGVGWVAVHAAILGGVAVMLWLILFSPFSLLMCSTTGGPQDIRAAIWRGCDVNARGGPGPALALAATEGRTANVRTLLDAGADVDGRTSRGRTPFMLAAMHDHWEAAQLLLSAGAHAAAVDHTGRTAADLARAAGSRRVLRLMERPALYTGRMDASAGHDSGGGSGARPTMSPAATPARRTVVEALTLAIVVLFGEVSLLVFSLPVSLQRRKAGLVLGLGTAWGTVLHWNGVVLGFQAPPAALFGWSALAAGLGILFWYGLDRQTAGL